MKKYILFIQLLLLYTALAYAQHEHMDMKKDSSKTMKQDTTPTHEHMMDMSVANEWSSEFYSCP